MGLCFPFCSQWELHQTATTSQILWIAALQHHLPVPSGPIDAPHQVSWTCAPSGSLDGLEPDLLPQWVFLHFLVPAFAFCDLGSVAGALAGEDRGKKLLSTSAVSISWVTRYLICFRRGLTFSLVLLLSLVYLQKLFVLPLTSLARLSSVRTSVFRI